MSHLDSVERPLNGSDTLFKRALKVFSGVIDEAIESKARLNDGGLDLPHTDDWDVTLNQDDVSFNFIGDGIQLDNLDLGITFDQWLV